MDSRPCGVVMLYNQAPIYLASTPREHRKAPLLKGRGAGGDQRHSTEAGQRSTPIPKGGDVCETDAPAESAATSHDGRAGGDYVEAERMEGLRWNKYKG